MSDSAPIPLRLSLDEAVLLLVGVKLLDQMVEAIEINGVAQEALMDTLIGKFQDVLSDDLAEMADRIVEDIISTTQLDESDLDAMTADSSYELPMYAVEGVMPVIEQAIAEHRSLEVSYFSMTREEFSHRRIDPYGLKIMGGLHWLIAHCHLRGDRRVFRIDRFRSAALTDLNFEAPSNFQVGEYFDE